VSAGSIKVYGRSDPNQGPQFGLMGKHLPNFMSRVLSCAMILNIFLSFLCEDLQSPIFLVTRICKICGLCHIMFNRSLSHHQYCLFCDISGFCHGVADVFALLRLYATSIGS
jgi:hypothetical protein